MRACDPFRAGPDLDAYVAHPEFEQNCRYLASKLEAEPTWVGIAGPSGVGKTLLLRLLMRRLESQFTPVYVPSGELSPAEVSRWVAAQLNADSEPCDDIAVRLARGGRPLLLAFDEAQLASPELIAWIEGLCRGLGAVRAMLAWTEYEGERVPAPLARCPTRVFVEPLELAEVPGYVEAQLARSGAAPELRAVLAGQTLERIALASGGNRRAIQRLADAELAAHAWRTRATPLHAGRASLARATENAPRAASGPAAPHAHPSLWDRRRPWLLTLATLVVLAAAALHFSR